MLQYCTVSYTYKTPTSYIHPCVWSNFATRTMKILPRLYSPQSRHATHALFRVVRPNLQLDTHRQTHRKHTNTEQHQKRSTHGTEQHRVLPTQHQEQQLTHDRLHKHERSTDLNRTDQSARRLAKKANTTALYCHTRYASHGTVKHAKEGAGSRQNSNKKQKKLNAWTQLAFVQP